MTPQTTALSGRFEAVLFDWDGTLVDSAELSYRCYVAAFAAFDIAFSREDYARTYSPDWHHTYELIGIPRDRYGEADARWIKAYAQEGTGLLPGARETLERIRAHGFVQGLVTSGDRQRVLREIGELGVARFFSALVCGGDVPQRKPHPLPFLTALDHLGVPGQRAVYVGDSPEDVQMARAAGAMTVGISGGFPNRQALVDSQPDVFCESLAEVGRALLG